MQFKLFKRFLTVMTISLVFVAHLTAGEKVTIVYTNSLNGRIDFCHCKEDPNGGLVKRATAVENLRKKYSTIFLFETGDFFLYDKDKLLAGYLIKGYKHIKYDAVVPGDQEFSIGTDDFLDYKNDLPFVCNNLLIDNGSGFKRYFKRNKIIKKGGVKAGIIGTLSSVAFKYYPKKFLKKIKLTSTTAEITKDIAYLKGKGVNFIVLLSHSGYDTDINFAKRFNDIDVIVGGHSQTLLKKPVKKGDTLIVQAGSNGAHIGVLELVVNRGSVSSYKNYFKRPDEFHPEDDSYIRGLINSYKKDLKKKRDQIKFN